MRALLLLGMVGCGQEELDHLLLGGPMTTGSIPSGSFQSVAVGAAHACALSHDGDVECWGEKLSGQQGSPYVQISAGNLASCGIRDDGALKCWGYVYPDRVPEGTLQEVQNAYDIFCALDTEGEVTCWMQF